MRYRVLDALVKALFPDKDTNSIDSLYAIAEANDISLPTFSDQTIAEEVFSQPQKLHSETPPENSEASAMRSPSLASNPSEAHSSIDDAPASPALVEEKLVPLPRGPSHYIGPSSSFGFVLTVRHMVAEFNAALRSTQLDDERSRISSDFAKSNWSKALEPISKAESDTSSDNDRDSSQGVATGPNRGLHGPKGPAKPTSAWAVSGRTRKPVTLSLLPSREVTDTFVEAYFSHVHPNYRLFHRGTFQTRYESMWAHPGALLKDQEPGWICCIFMMLVFGAQALESRDKAESLRIQHHYLEMVQSRLHSLVSTSTLVNVQALLLLQLYQHNNTERNSAFMLLGCASRMAMALGMHREGTSGGFDEMEREVRKRVWWTLYVFEQNQCAILGRPCAIDDMEVNVTFPDEIMLEGTSPDPPGYVEYLVRITKLMSDVRRKIYASPSNPAQHGDHPKVGVAIQFLLDLDSWYNSLPAALRLDCLTHTPWQRRAVTLLHVQFHHTQALVARPFILRKVSVQLARRLGKHVRSQDLDKEEVNLSNACGEFSRKTVDLLNQLLATGMFDGVAWLDAYYIYHAVFILALDFLARPWDDQDTAEDAARKKAVRDIADALQDVKLCPTFAILVPVALQLAKIVGIFDPQPVPNNERIPKTEEIPQYYNQLQSQLSQSQSSYPLVPQGTLPIVENGINSWFQKGPVDIPWDFRDFFGVDASVGLGPAGSFTYFSAPMGNIYRNHIPGIDEDSMAQPLPPDISYIPWGAVENPYAQPNRGGGS
jgi:proline utilization trans-activator